MQQQNFTPLYPPLQVRAGVLVVDGFGIALRVLVRQAARGGRNRQAAPITRTRSCGQRPRTPRPDRQGGLAHPGSASVAARDRCLARADRPRWRGARTLRAARLRGAPDLPRPGACGYERFGRRDRARPDRRQTRRTASESGSDLRGRTSRVRFAAKRAEFGGPIENVRVMRPEGFSLFETTHRA